MTTKQHPRGMRMAACIVAFSAIPSISSAATPRDAVAKAPEPLAAPIAIDGAPAAIALKPAGRAGHLSFQARAGEHFGFALSAVKFTPASAAALVVTVRHPDGKPVPGTSPVHCMAATPANPDAACNGAFTVPHAGRYVLDVDAPFSAAAEFKAALSRPAQAKLSIGTPHPVVLSRRGQDARLSVEVPADAAIAVSASGPSLFALKVFAPDGALLSQVRGDPTNPASLGLPARAGRYVVEIVPANAATGNFAVLAKAAGAATIGGSPVDVKSASASDIVRVGFSSGEPLDIALAVQDLKFSPDGDGAAVLAVEKEDGTRVAENRNCRTRGLQHAPDFVMPCTLATRIRQAGRYIATIKPPAGGAVSGRLQISQTLSGSLVSGAPVSLTSMQPGQNARYAFAASAGHQLKILMPDLVTSPRDKRVKVTVHQLEGGFMHTTLVFPYAANLAAMPIKASGKFEIVVDPGDAAIESAHLTVVESEGVPQ